DRGEAAELREAQSRALSLPATGMAVTLDIGDPKDIHPRDKRTVGNRLARQALVIAYGRNDADAQGPVYAGRDVQDGRVRIRFDHVGRGLSPTKGSVDGFVVAGADRRFFVADAVVEGNEVVVSSPKVPQPVAVRYGWSAAPRATLFGTNTDGSLLPAAPFRTDDWVRPADGWPPPRDSGATAYLSADPAMRPLFNGHDLSGWTNINCAPGTFTVQDGMIHCTGVPTGLLRTDRMYENYELELEWRHLSEQGNAGLFIWSDALTAPGQPFSRAVEVQVMVGAEGDWYTSDGDVFPIHGATMTPENGRGGSRAFPTEKRMKPSPEWNHYLVTCNNGDVSLAVNGKVVTRGRNASPRKGYICLESEGTPIDFRNIRIKELPPASPALAPELVATTDEGFRTIYTGVDLSGWKAGPEQVGHWQPADWVLRYDGAGADLWTDRSYRDFQMIVDWRFTREPVETERPLIGSDGNEIQGSDGKTKTAKVADAGDSGIYLRGNSKSQVNIWCWPAGSGEVWGYRTDGNMPAAVRAAATPRERADNPPGQWNRFLITMKGDQLTVVLNGRTVIENAVLPGVPAEGPIGLQHHGDPIEFANIFVREIGG
ncbi:MAG: DUF1080 domain-containing protein, partial [Phycisphaerales bacterium]|nr:DUF1080 domain-containing protein [Phycisphaerales bacterium]